MVRGQIWRRSVRGLAQCIANFTLTSPVMPRMLLVRPRGGAMGKVRKRYAIIEKIMLLNEVKRIHQEGNLSLQGVAAEIGVNHCLLVKWTKELPKLQAHARLNKLAIIDGPNGQLHPIEEELLMWMFAKHEQGIQIRHSIIALRASSMLRTIFGSKLMNAKILAIVRFMQKHNYVYCQKMNKATHAPQEVYDEAHEFLDNTCPLLHGLHHDRQWIFNMDQTPLPFSFQSSKMLAKHGSTTIHMWKMTNETKRVTLALRAIL